jgi:hypothetical protein
MPRNIFTAGNQFGKHGNHWKNGSMTKEQVEILRGLIPNSLDTFKFVLNSPQTSLAWMQLKVQVAEKIISKFIPDTLDVTIDNTQVSEQVTGLINDFKQRLERTKTEIRAIENRGISALEVGDVQGQSN